MLTPLERDIDRVEWGFYARVKREATILYLAGFPVIAPVVLIFGQSWVTYLFAGAYLSRYAWAWRHWKRWPCPRCHLPFISGRGWSGFHDLFPDRRCKHCGLPEYIPFLPGNSDGGSRS